MALTSRPLLRGTSRASYKSSIPRVRLQAGQSLNSRGVRCGALLPGTRLRVVCEQRDLEREDGPKRGRGGGRKNKLMESDIPKTYSNRESAAAEEYLNAIETCFLVGVEVKVRGLLLGESVLQALMLFLRFAVTSF